MGRVSLDTDIAAVRKIDFGFFWKPVYLMMEEGIGPIPEHLRTKIVNDLYERGTEHCCRRVSYVLQNDKLHHLGQLNSVGRVL